MPVASVVLGFVGLGLSFFPNLRFLGVPLAILATVFGIVSLRKAKREGKPTKVAKLGFGVGLAGMIVGVVFIAVLGTAEQKLDDVANDPALKAKMQQADKEFQNAFNAAIEDTQGDGGN